MSVAVVIPTIDGREEHLARCLAAYEATAPDVRVIIEHGWPSCGAAWLAGAAAAGEFDHLHLTADDLEPHDGWLDVALKTVGAGYIPAPLVFNPDGSLDSAGLAGFGQYRGPHDDWQLVEGTTVPFLTREMWEAISSDDFAETMGEIHYCTDLMVSAAARRHGWETVIRTDMAFTHHTAAAGRNYGRAWPDTQRYTRWVAA